MAVIVVIPILIMVVYAFTAGGSGGGLQITAENFTGMSVYASVFLRSFRLALIATYTKISSTVYAMTKWYDTYDATYTTQVGNDFPHLRYADVVLMYAEALASTDGIPAALPWLNKTRTRAGLDELTTAEVPDKNTFVRELAAERGREFALEGHRWFDLVRLGLAVEYFQGLGYSLDAHNLLFPIPQSQIEIVNNKSILWQNPGF